MDGWEGVGVCVAGGVSGGGGGGGGVEVVAKGGSVGRWIGIWARSLAMISIWRWDFIRKEIM